MKYWMPGVIALMAMPAVHAANYRLVYSPSQKLEVFIDDVKNNKPASWCAKNIPLRIVSAKSRDAAVLNDFLPRVGNLLEKQCAKATQLPWTLTDKSGATLASGNASKNRKWQPEIAANAAAQSTEPAPAPPPAVAVNSAPADASPAQVFTLPQGCKFRTYWGQGNAGSALFIPSGDALQCVDGWLNGSSAVTLQQGGKTLTPSVSFYQGYPLMNIDVATRPLKVVSANTQRLVLANPQAAGSYLLLPFDAKQHAWIFNGALIAELPRLEAADAERVKQRVAEVQAAWQPLLSERNATLTVRLVDKLVADRADPASGSYLSVNNVAH
ncbi:type VI secretion system-associated protein [Serratia odorifera]|uniref:type VI secretion system-associated protein n=1 Tax=Serratia odorifera TaxID=618 RepID=UPI003D287589